MTEYTGLTSLTHYDHFAYHYRQVAQQVADHFQVTVSVHEPILRRAFISFIRGLNELSREALSQRAIFGRSCAIAVNSTGRASKFVPQGEIARTITKIYSDDDDVLIKIDVQALRRNSDQIIAILFGAGIYLLESTLRSEQEPDCQLSFPHAVWVGKTLAIEPVIPKQFLRAIKRPKKNER